MGRLREQPSAFYLMTSSTSGLLVENASSVAEAISKGGREGTLRSVERADADSFLDEEDKPNPELLFAGAYAACFHSALIAVAKKRQAPLVESVVRARVGQVKDEAGEGRLAVELHAELPGVAAEQARDLMEAAHRLCPYSKALRGEAAVVLVVD